MDSSNNSDSTVSFVVNCDNEKREYVFHNFKFFFDSENIPHLDFDRMDYYENGRGPIHYYEVDFFTEDFCIEYKYFESDFIAYFLKDNSNFLNKNHNVFDSCWDEHFSVLKNFVSVNSDNIITCLPQIDINASGIVHFHLSRLDLITSDRYVYNCGSLTLYRDKSSDFGFSRISIPWTTDESFDDYEELFLNLSDGLLPVSYVSDQYVDEIENFYKTSLNCLKDKENFNIKDFIVPSTKNSYDIFDFYSQVNNFSDKHNSVYSEEGVVCNLFNLFVPQNDDDDPFGFCDSCNKEFYDYVLVSKENFQILLDNDCLYTIKEILQTKDNYFKFCDFRSKLFYSNTDNLELIDIARKFNIPFKRKVENISYPVFHDAYDEKDLVVKLFNLNDIVEENNFFGHVKQFYDYIPVTQENFQKLLDNDCLYTIDAITSAGDMQNSEECNFRYHHKAVPFLNFRDKLFYNNSKNPYLIKIAQENCIPYKKELEPSFNNKHDLSSSKNIKLKNCLKS